MFRNGQSMVIYKEKKGLLSIRLYLLFSSCTSDIDTLMAMSRRKQPRPKSFKGKVAKQIFYVILFSFL